jgi:hypothetical protein
MQATGYHAREHAFLPEASESTELRTMQPSTSNPLPIIAQ